jgi:hypothetical protein
MRVQPVRKPTIALLVALVASIAAVADETTISLVSRVLEDFDEPQERVWYVRGSKFITSGYPEQAMAETWPIALFGRRPNDPNLRALGIHGSFTRRGYNSLEIIPAVQVSGGVESAPIRLPGRVQTIDLWVWGSNHNYYIDIHLRDYQGVDYVLNLGSVRFEGWKNLTVKVPSSIPQTQPYLPRFRGLELTKLVLWTRPEEKVDDFYIYLDHLKVLTDTFEQRYDGDDLVDQQVLDAIWGAPQGSTR